MKKQLIYFIACLILCVNSLLSISNVNASDDAMTFGTDECNKAFDKYNQEVVEPINKAITTFRREANLDDQFKYGDLDLAHQHFDQAIKASTRYVKRSKNDCTKFQSVQDNTRFKDEYHTIKGYLYFITGDWSNLKKHLTFVNAQDSFETIATRYTDINQTVTTLNYLYITSLYGYQHRTDRIVERHHYRKALVALLIAHPDPTLDEKLSREAFKIFSKLKPLPTVVESMEIYHKKNSIFSDQSFPYSLPILLEGLKHANAFLVQYQKLSISEKALLQANYFKPTVHDKLNYLLQLFWVSKDYRFYDAAKQHISKYHLGNSQDKRVMKFVLQLEEAKKLVDAGQ